MAAGGIQRSVRGLFWATALLVAALWYIPAVPPPPPSTSALPSRCLPTWYHYDRVVVWRFYLFACILCTMSLTFCAKVSGLMPAATGDLPKAGRDGAGATPWLQRATLLAAVAFSTIGAGVAATAYAYLVQLRLGVLLTCMSSPVLVYASLVAVAVAICYYFASLAMVAVSE